MRAKTLERHIRAENEHDLDGIVATYAPAGVVEVNGRAISGADAIRAFHRDFGFGGDGAFDDVRLTELRRHTIDGGFVLEQRLAGTHVRTWRGIEPTHRRVDVAACTIYVFDEEGRLASERAFVDFDGIERQLGARSTRVLVDEALARRLERATGVVGAAHVDARKTNAMWRDIDGVIAMYDGPRSEVTQTFGFGLASATEATLDAIEAFYRERGCETSHEISTLAPASTLTMLAQRGYLPIEVSNVHVRSLDGVRDVDPPPGLVVRAARPDERDVWIATSTAGWTDDPVLAREIEGYARITFDNARVSTYVVEIDGRPIATGALAVTDDIASLAGASTLPAYRGRGAQRSLVAHRLAEARRRRCTLATQTAKPGSTSAHNAERGGFAIAYARTKWRLG
jgi:hypothetical protein